MLFGDSVTQKKRNCRLEVIQRPQLMGPSEHRTMKKNSFEVNGAYFLLN